MRPTPGSVSIRRRFHSCSKESQPCITDMISRRIPSAPGTWRRKWQACCFVEKLASGGRQPPDGANNQGADAPRSPRQRVISPGFLQSTGVPFQSASLPNAGTKSASAANSASASAQAVKVFVAGQDGDVDVAAEFGGAVQDTGLPPMSSARTRCFRKVERTLPIGLGIKRASQCHEGAPEVLRFLETLCRCQAPPRQRFGVFIGLIGRNGL